MNCLVPSGRDRKHNSSLWVPGDDTSQTEVTYGYRRGATPPPPPYYDY